MRHGRFQICAFREELVYGVPRTPNAALGIVTEGEFYDNTEVRALGMPESPRPARLSYGKNSCGGNVTFILQNLSILSWGIVRPLASYTLDCGVYTANIPATRFAGSKVEGMDIRFQVGSVVTVNLRWISKFATEGGANVDPPAPYPIWQTHFIGLFYNNVLMPDVESITISINNRLTPIYLANRQNALPRTLSRLGEGTADITASVTLYDRVVNPARLIQPLHDIDGFTLTVVLVDPCSSSEASISLLNCYQKSVSEPFTLGPVPNKFEVVARNIQVNT